MSAMYEEQREAERISFKKAVCQENLDSFAKAIATGLFANHGWMQNFKAQYYGDDIDRAMASIVYDLAEAMMAEREKRMK